MRPETALRHQDASTRTAANTEALAILAAMQAQGTRPAGHDDWIPAFRHTLGLPTDF